MFERATRNAWRSRTEVAEAKVAELQQTIDGLREHLAGIELRMADRAVLMSITRQDRLNRFMFVRNGNITLVETYSALEDDLPGWKKELLE